MAAMELMVILAALIAFMLVFLGSINELGGYARIKLRGMENALGENNFCMFNSQMGLKATGNSIMGIGNNTGSTEKCNGPLALDGIKIEGKKREFG
ncbi:MAG: hypothetical protein V1835_06900 [Candidatus Micrarchaeota archaeon]